MATDIIIYTTAICPYCVQAKALLDKKQVSYQEIRVDTNPAALAEMMEKSGRRSVPQIFINGQAIGGCDDLYQLEQNGQLNDLLK